MTIVYTEEDAKLKLCPMNIERFCAASQCMAWELRQPARKKGDIVIGYRARPTVVEQDSEALGCCIMVNKR